MNEGRLTSAQFRALMQTVADGWNEGNARKAADCFAEDADYTEPRHGDRAHRGRHDPQLARISISLCTGLGSVHRPQPVLGSIDH